MSVSFLPKLIGSYYSGSEFTDVNKGHSPEHSFQDFHGLAQPCFPVLFLSYVLYLSILLTFSPWTYYIFSRHCFRSYYKHRWKHRLSSFSGVCRMAACPLKATPVPHSKEPYLVPLNCNELLLSQKFHSPLHFMIVLVSFCPKIVVFFFLPALLGCKTLRK